MRLPAYLKARYLTIGLLLGALWGFLSMLVFVTVGSFGDTDHPYHWLFQIFQASVNAWWFRTVLLPFMLSIEAGYFFAFFGSTPVGAIMGVLIGAVVSMLSYVVRKKKSS